MILLGPDIFVVENNVEDDSLIDYHHATHPIEHVVTQHSIYTWHARYTTDLHVPCISY